MSEKNIDAEKKIKRKVTDVIGVGRSIVKDAKWTQKTFFSR